MQEIKVFVTRVIPDTGIDLLKKEGYSVTIWPHDRPIPSADLIAEGKELGVTELQSELDGADRTATRTLGGVGRFGCEVSRCAGELVVGSATGGSSEKQRSGERSAGAPSPKPT